LLASVLYHICPIFHSTICYERFIDRNGCFVGNLLEWISTGVPYSETIFLSCLLWKFRIYRLRYVCLLTFIAIFSNLSLGSFSKWLVRFFIRYVFLNFNMLRWFLWLRILLLIMMCYSLHKSITRLSRLNIRTNRSLWFLDFQLSLGFLFRFYKEHFALLLILSFLWLEGVNINILSWTLWTYELSR
jgi:hypothetical protein